MNLQVERVPMKTQQQYIDGMRTDAQSNVVFQNYSPSTGEKICDIQTALKPDVDRAVTAAQEGFKKWSSLSGTQRGRILHRASEIIRARIEEIAHLEVLDTGKPLSEALAVDVHSGADAIEYFAGISAGIQGSHISLGASYAYTRREPLGVCAAIGAWNYPFQIACWKAAPALACGNSVLFKPSPLTPLTALILAEIFTEAGLPNGVFNVLQGGAETGNY